MSQGIIAWQLWVAPGAVNPLNSGLSEFSKLKEKKTCHFGVGTNVHIKKTRADGEVLWI